MNYSDLKAGDVLLGSWATSTSAWVLLRKEGGRYTWLNLTNGAMADDGEDVNPINGFSVLRGGETIAEAK